jgi:RNA polymerase sigma-70 factor (ECF subfamily)
MPGPEVAPVDEPDAQVVAAARRGDVGAFETIVRTYQRDVWRLAFHLVHNESLADDITQDAFIRVFRFLSRYRGDSRFSTWLFSIARNCARDELRRSFRRNRTADRATSEIRDPPTDETVRVEVRDALAGLPLELREPVVLIDMLGMSYAEVSTTLRLPEGTVKSRVHRARAALADLLLPDREESSDEV